MVKITDTWEGNPVTLGLKHLVPGFWDIWHQLGSPPAEKPPYKVVKRALGYVIREYAPRMATQPSLIDYSNSREVSGSKKEDHEFSAESSKYDIDRGGRGGTQVNACRIR